MSYVRSTRPAQKSAASFSLQPWHIAVFIIALALGAWRLTSMAVGARQAGDTKVVKNAAEQTRVPPKASPKTLKMIADKDADADD